jgi:hypothetical protein
MPPSVRQESQEQLLEQSADEVLDLQAMAAADVAGDAAPAVHTEEAQAHTQTEDAGEEDAAAEEQTAQQQQDQAHVADAVHTSAAEVDESSARSDDGGTAALSEPSAHAASEATPPNS